MRRGRASRGAVGGLRVAPWASRLLPSTTLGTTLRLSKGRRLRSVGNRRTIASEAKPMPNCISLGGLALKMRPKFGVPKMRLGRSKFTVSRRLKISHGGTF
jgi:hypothetical protein